MSDYVAVIGIDPSLTAAGVSDLYRDGSGDHAHYGRKGSRTETLPQRHERLTMILDRIAGHLPLLSPQGSYPALVIIEGPSHGSVGGSAWDRAGLWWRIVDAAYERGCDVAVVAPFTRAKWATGNGRADKATVAAALSRRHNVEADCDNCYDAAGLALMGAHALGWVQAPQYARDAMCAVTWPEAVAARVLAPYEQPVAAGAP